MNKYTPFQEHIEHKLSLKKTTSFFLKHFEITPFLELRELKLCYEEKTKNPFDIRDVAQIF